MVRKGVHTTKKQNTLLEILPHWPTGLVGKHHITMLNKFVNNRFTKHNEHPLQGYLLVQVTRK